MNLSVPAAPGGLWWLAAVAISAVVASSGFWWWLIASRKLTTSEYRTLIEELRKERDDRGAEVSRLDGVIERQDSEIYKLRLDLTALSEHVETLEAIIRRTGADVPARPRRRTSFGGNGNGH